MTEEVQEKANTQPVIRVIHKQQMPILGVEEFYLTLPWDAHILHIAPQQDYVPAIWYSFDKRVTNAPEKRRFRWIPTGMEFEDEEISRLDHIGTVVLPGQGKFPQFVYHLFEIVV